MLSCAASAWGLSAWATVLRAVPIATLARRADAVVVARRVTGLDLHAEMRGGRIVTTSELEVSRVLARRPLGPEPGPRVSLVTPGGVVDGPSGPIAQRVEGTPDIPSDRWSIVLLHRTAEGSWTVLNLALGVLPLSPPAPGQQDWRVLPPSTYGVTLVDAEGRPATTSALGVPPAGITVAEFVNSLTSSPP